jgi:GNAT superfamily N-acetyltransferase
MDEFAVRATARWRTIDPLLPDALTAAGPGSAGDCGAGLAVGHGGNLAAFGTCRHSEPGAGDIDLSWGMARRFELTPRVVGPDAASALGRLISLWRDHLADVAGSGDDDTAAVISWPSRDIEGVAALQSHGLRPLAVVAARPSARTSAHPDGRVPRHAPGRETRIRRAGAADAETIATFGAEVARFDAYFSGTPGRAGTVAALRHEATRLLAPAQPDGDARPDGNAQPDRIAGPDRIARPDGNARPWAWLAEKNGTPVGMIATQRPDRATWIAPMTRLAPVAYTMLGYVSPQERSAGVGAALAACLHAEVDPAGVAATLLHYEQLNPYAAPFWSRQGYRPLWTTWEARPARSLR